MGSFILAGLLKGFSVRSNPSRSATQTSSALKAAICVTTVAERFLFTRPTATEAEWFFFGYSGTVGQSDNCFSTIYAGRAVGENYDF